MANFDISCLNHTTQVLKNIATVALTILCFQVLGQIPHEKPDHPKGNAATQMLALPFYNEACELYAKGEVFRAKLSLYEAINTSFALTEAHLFLADILREENKLDSAFYFYNSGIDFAIEQKPHYYFHLFKLGIDLGQYGIVKHNMKHFKKLYGKLDKIQPYEKNFPYTYTDYETFKNQIEFLYNYESWDPRAEKAYELPGDQQVNSLDGNEYISENGNLSRVYRKKGKIKTKSLKGLPKGMIHPFVAQDKSVVIYALEKEGQTALYFSTKSGSKYSEPKKLPEAINASDWIAHPFLAVNGEHLYFSKKVKGNKDLFVAKIDWKNNQASEVKPLTRVNTEADEIAPFIDPETKWIYFSSNRQAGFGGFDLYESRDYEVINSVCYPFNERNMGSPYNSYKDETKIGFNEGKVHVERQKNDKKDLYVYTKKENESLYYEIRPIEITRIDTE